MMIKRMMYSNRNTPCGGSDCPLGHFRQRHIQDSTKPAKRQALFYLAPLVAGVAAPAGAPTDLFAKLST